MSDVRKMTDAELVEALLNAEGAYWMSDVPVSLSDRAKQRDALKAELLRRLSRSQEGPRSPEHGVCPHCGADRSGPSAEAHNPYCPEAAASQDGVDVEGLAQKVFEPVDALIATGIVPRNELLNTIETVLRSALSAPARSNSRPVNCECGHPWHGDEQCSWTGTEEGMKLECQCFLSYVVFDEEYFAKGGASRDAEE